MKKLFDLFWIIKIIIIVAFIILSLLIRLDKREEDVETISGNYKKYVALTFDDGPHKVYTKQLLYGLKERNVRATFFLVGKNIKGNEALVEQMYKDGHIIGNHTYSHTDIKKINKTSLNKELESTNELIFNITGERVKYLRPPFGEVNFKEAAINDMTIVMWSLDTKDWENTNTDLIVKNIMENVKDGDIILMHDIFPSSVSSALKVIDELRKKGYEFVTVEDLIIE